VTDNNDAGQRPNANYKLSKPDNAADTGEEGLTFYYNREKRLAKAPQSVKDLYKENKNNRFNLLRPLIADKPRATVFFTIILLCAAIFLLSVLGYFDRVYRLERNKLEISGTVFEGTTIIILKKTIDSRLSAYTGAVDIAVSPPVEDENEQFSVFYHRVFFTLEPEEEYRFAVPFDTPELLLVFQTEKTSLQIRIKPE
jgi:hypothetical protein